MLRFFLLIFLFGCGEIQEPKSESDSPEPEDAADGVSSENNITLPDSSVNLKDDDPLILPSKLPPKNGLVIEWHDDKTQKNQTNFSNGVKNGKSLSWFPNGQLKEKCFYLDDRLEGEFLGWHENGVLRLKGTYSNGKQDGEWIIFDSSGNAMPSVFYKDGMEVTRELPSLRD